MWTGGIDSLESILGLALKPSHLSIPSLIPIPFLSLLPSRSPKLSHPLFNPYTVCANAFPLSFKSHFINLLAISRNHIALTVESARKK
jgi:hypothetical protein